MLVTLAYPHEGHQPDETIEVDDATGRQLVRDGQARLPEPSVLDDMRADDLRAYAAEHRIDLAGATKKADMAAAIRAAEHASIPPQSPITPVTGTNEQES